MNLKTFFRPIGFVGTALVKAATGMLVVSMKLVGFLVALVLVLFIVMTVISKIAPGWEPLSLFFTFLILCYLANKLDSFRNWKKNRAENK